MRVIVANWKMNMTEHQVTAWIAAWQELYDPHLLNVKVIVAPSFVHLAAMTELKTLDGMHIGAQDVSVFADPIHTGEIGATQLADYCEFCIVGHSERAEPVDTVMQKAKMCLSAGIVPIICFINPADVKKYHLDGAILAWEDPQNISKNGVYTPKEPEEIHKQLADMKNQLPNGVKILYGGSTDINFARSNSQTVNLDGVLVGNASLDPVHFYEICRHL